MKKYIILGIVCLVFITVISFVLLFDSKDDIKLNEENDYILLDDYSRFFTVNSCIYKYIVFLASDDVDSVLNILDKDYINSNNINKNNIYNFVDKLDGNYTFTSKKIYYKKINKYYISYYVYGFLVQEFFESSNTNKTVKYFKVDLDLKNQLFSIAPYDGKIFKEETNE